VTGHRQAERPVLSSRPAALCQQAVTKTGRVQCSSGPVMVSVFLLTWRCGGFPATSNHSSLIRTITVGSGIGPDQPQNRWAGLCGSRAWYAACSAAAYPTVGGDFHPAPKFDAAGNL